MKNVNKAYWLGKKMSIETKNKMSLAQKNRIRKVKDVVLKGEYHRYIERRFGKPNYCEECKRTDKKKYEWANKDHKYSRNIKDYMRLCTSCHRKYDILNNNYSGFWWTDSTKKCPATK